MRGAACTLFALGLFSAESRAETPEPESPGAVERPPSFEWTTGIVAGISGVGRDGFWDETRFCGSVRGDMLFGRERGRSVGYGPYASLGTLAFDDLRPSAGASVLLPVLDDLPIVLSVGGMAKLANGPARPGAEAWLFWGVRSYNFHSPYNLSNGLLLGAQTTFEGDPEHAIWLAAQVDAAIPLLPFVYLYALATGG